MMRLKIYLSVCAVAVVLSALATKQEFWAFSAGDYNQKELTAAGYLATDGEEVAMDYIRRCNQTQPGSIRTEAVEHYLDKGYLAGYAEELKQSGYISSEYVVKTISGTSSAGEEISEEHKEPEPFTVEALEPEKTMWASQEVNYRDGASTDYSKLGSFQKYDTVTVTGIASTGWYQIVLADGNTAYVSNRYLTEENPASQTVFHYNTEDGVVETITVEDEDPEIVEKAVEQIISKSQMTSREVVKINGPTPEPEEIIPTESAIVETNNPHEYFNTWYLIGAAGSMIIFYIALVMIVKRRKLKL